MNSVNPHVYLYHARMMLRVSKHHSIYIYTAVSRKILPGRYSISTHQHAPLTFQTVGTENSLQAGKTLQLTVPESHHWLPGVFLFFV